MKEKNEDYHQPNPPSNSFTLLNIHFIQFYMFVVNTYILRPLQGTIFLFNKKKDYELLSSRQGAWFKNPSEAHNPKHRA